MPDAYLLTKYLHLLAFAYWLGADLGVFYAARYAVRSDLAMAERRRFLALTLLVDMAPRTALILTVPTGLSLAMFLGLIAPDGRVLALVCVASLAWLALAWYLFLAIDTQRGAFDAWRRVDLLLRLIVIAIFGLMGIAALLGFGPIGPAWLGLKSLGFACVIALGLLLRRVLREWLAGLQLVSSGEDVELGNARVRVAARQGERFALLLWGLLCLIAWLGLAKPAFSLTLAAAAQTG